MTRNIKTFFLIIVACLICGNIIYAQDNHLSRNEKRHGWELLFNGNNLDGWTSIGKNGPPEKGWIIEKGVLTTLKNGDSRGGDIITEKEYSDFDLRIDFNITKGANSGIKYFFTKYDKGGWLGCEYQIIDNDNHPDAKLGHDGNRQIAALYDVLPANVEKSMKPVGEWNHARIVAKGRKVTHYLNGKKVLTYDRYSEEYKKALILSKFKGCIPTFGEVERGHILLQEHGDEVSFKNIKIKVL